jgi:small subunit ribosomal protein S20
MPMNKSMEKRLRQLRKATARNRTYRSRMRTAIRAASEAAEEKADALPATLSQAQKLIDKAAKVHAIHARTAARIKSRLMKQLAGV